MKYRETFYGNIWKQGTLQRLENRSFGFITYVYEQ